MDDDTESSVAKKIALLCTYTYLQTDDSVQIQIAKKKIALLLDYCSI